MDKEIKNAVIALESGETILYPTDTVWGIGCNALSDNAAKKIFKLKKRDYSNGLICLASNFEMISKYADISEIEKLNQKFSNPEQIKKFSILPRDFSIDEGELTPTLKIRRKQINKNWADTIDKMYSE